MTCSTWMRARAHSPAISAWRDAPGRLSRPPESDPCFSRYWPLSSPWAP
ncbi:Uncharacterised protein [Bordetella pertussis]|nr:Uncharacterised protein [Bordetella pertussis]